MIRLETLLKVDGKDEVWDPQLRPSHSIYGSKISGDEVVVPSWWKI